MTKQISRVLEIMRGMIGQMDSSNPQATDAKLLVILNEFIQLHSPGNSSFIQDKTFYTFNTTSGIDTQSWPSNYIVPHDPIYIGGIQGTLYTDPYFFYGKWQKDVTYDSARPTDILYHANTLTMRAPPDDTYSVDISAFRVNESVTSDSSVFRDEYYRYYASGAALLWFQENGDLDERNAYKEIHKENKLDILAQTVRVRANQPVQRSF